MAECYVNSHLHLFICTHIKLSQAKSKIFSKSISGFFFCKIVLKKGFSCVLTCALVVTSAFAEKSASCALEGGVGGRSRKAGRREGKSGINSSEVLNLLKKRYFPIPGNEDVSK